MMLRKFQAFDTGATHYCIREKFLGRSVANSMMLTDEIPRGIKAQVLMDMRKEVRAIINRAKRKHAIASKR